MYITRLWPKVFVRECKRFSVMQRLFPKPVKLNDQKPYLIPLLYRSMWCWFGIHHYWKPWVVLSSWLQHQDLWLSLHFQHFFLSEPLEMIFLRIVLLHILHQYPATKKRQQCIYSVFSEHKIDQIKYEWMCMHECIFRLLIRRKCQLHVSTPAREMMLYQVKSF